MKKQINVVCQICNKEFCGYSYLTAHIHKHHNISAQEYYDKFIKQENEEICPTCHGQNKFLNLGKGYTQHCSLKCSNSNKDKQHKGQQTCLKHFGVEHHWKSDIIKEKIKQTNKIRYGAEYAQQTASYKKMMSEQHKQRWQINHNAYVQKTKETCLNKYGVDSSNKSKEIQQKQQNTLFKHYSITNPGQHNDIIDAKRKQTNIERYGTEHPCQSEYIKQKHIETCLAKYGVQHTMQNREIMLKTRQKFKKDGKCYDSSWEYYFEQWLLANNIKFEYQPNIFYWYEFEGKKHRYFPDFTIYNDDGTIKEIIDIKGDHLMAKMLDPTTKEHQKYLCILANNVKLLFKQDLISLGILQK